MINGPPRRPQTQGHVERFNQTITRQIAKNLNGSPKCWVDVHGKRIFYLLLDDLILHYNTTIHSAINNIPFAVFKKRPFNRGNLGGFEFPDGEGEEIQRMEYNIIYEEDADEDLKTFEITSDCFRQTNAYKQVHLCTMRTITMMTIDL